MQVVKLGHIILLLVVTPYCRGSSHVGVSELMSRPKIISSSEVFNYKETDKVLMPCEVEDLGSYSVIWKKDRQVIQAGPVKVARDDRIVVHHNHSLEIKNITKEDAGTYKCYISMKPEMDIFHTLNVLYSPQITINPEDGLVVARKGENIRIICEALGNPSPRIQWEKKEGHVPKTNLSFEGKTLQFVSIDRSDSGTYFCRASNGIGMPAWERIDVQVLYSPEIEVTNSIIHSGVGYEAELSCIIRAEPLATMTWYFEGKPVNPSHSTQKEAKGKHSLQIVRTEIQDFGTYTCKANNTLGSAQADVKLTGKPNKVEFTSKPQGRQLSSYTLEWKSESYSRIIDFKLWYRKIATNDSKNIIGKWQNYTVAGDKRTPFKVIMTNSVKLDNLDPGSQYEVVIKPRNSHGWGEEAKFEFFTISGEGHAQSISTNGCRMTVRPLSEVYFNLVISVSVFHCFLTKIK